MRTRAQRGGDSPRKGAAPHERDPQSLRTCGKPSPSSYCADHTPKPWTGSRRRKRLSVSGWEEQRRAKRVMKRYLGTCYICGGPADAVDHVIPLAEGGVDSEVNLRPICEADHKLKTAEEAKRARQRPSGGAGRPGSASDVGIDGAGEGARADSKRGEV